MDRAPGGKKQGLGLWEGKARTSALVGKDKDQGSGRERQGPALW